MKQHYGTKSNSRFSCQYPDKFKSVSERRLNMKSVSFVLNDMKPIKAQELVMDWSSFCGKLTSLDKFFAAQILHDFLRRQVFLRNFLPDNICRQILPDIIRQTFFVGHFFPKFFADIFYCTNFPTFSSGDNFP